MNSNKEFKVGKHSIGWIGPNFQEHFGDMDFKKTKPKLQVKVLERDMTDREIIAEWKPQESTLGDLLFALDNDILSKNGYANIFHIRDKKGTLWAVIVRWDSGSREWGVGAGSVDSSRPWRRGDRVLSQVFGSVKLESSVFVTRKEFEDFKKSVGKILNLN